MPIPSRPPSNGRCRPGSATIVTIGIDIETSRKAAEIAGSYDRIYASAGIHPHASFSLDARDLRELEKIAANRRVVAIGEIGLDYFRDRQPRPIQIECMKTSDRDGSQNRKTGDFSYPGCLGGFFSNRAGICLIPAALRHALFFRRLENCAQMPGPGILSLDPRRGHISQKPNSSRTS